MAWQALSQWDAKRWTVAALSGIAFAILVALPTAVIPNPVFGRAVEVTWWSYPVVVITGILGGLLMGTYVRQGDDDIEEEKDRASVLGGTGALLSFFAVGCPVCNKLVLVALGASGAIAWFAPIQPILALASIVLMTVALHVRLRGERQCAVPTNPVTTSTGMKE